MHTPWGQAQQTVRIADGITGVSTASHGGIHLSRSRQQRMPILIRKTDGWYEEDCEISWVLIYYPELFQPAEVTQAHRSAARWFPDEYTRLYGTETAV